MKHRYLLIIIITLLSGLGITLPSGGQALDSATAVLFPPLPADSCNLEDTILRAADTSFSRTAKTSGDSFNISLAFMDSFNPEDSASRTKQRTKLMAGMHAGLYAGTLLVLNEAWYKDYPRGKFRFFNDFDEWLQIDKVGHAWSGYQLSRASYAGWKWAGVPEKKQVWLAGLGSFGFLTIIEVLDGFSEEWGWSWGDFGANVAGAGLFIGQQLGWKEERISFKFSFHRMQYNDPMLNTRSDELYGKSLPERMLKDYNGQTYWLSANLKSFLPQSNLPPWLNIAVGYGGSGMFGGTENRWISEANGQAFDRTDITRVRQWYLAPDIDFTRIKTNSKLLRSVFFCLNAFKMPAPALVLSKGKFRVQGFYF